jgi:cell volume regulation protein A
MFFPSIESVLATSEPGATAIWLAVIGVLVGSCVLLSRFSERLGVPVVLLFLVLGMLGGSEGIGGIAFEDYALAVRIGTLALVLILLDGGLNTTYSAVRQVFWPSTVLATVGVLLTAAAVAGFGRLLGLTWTEALLLGAVVSSTDAAAVFAVLRGGRISLRPRLGRTLEVESCVNDPMAIILTVALVQVFQSGAGNSEPNWLRIVLEVPVQLAVGVGVGLAVGYIGRWMLRRVRLTTAGLYPALTISLGFVSFGAATMVWGSGFMAVFATGLVLGNARRLPFGSSLGRVHDAIAWLSQIGIFLMLGLLVFPSRLVPVAWLGLTLGVFLALIARPAAVWLCTRGFGFDWRETTYLSVVGLRGAVPVILATFPVLAGVPGADKVFNLVFFIVVVSSFMPGMLIRPLARWLKVNVPDRPTPATVLEINAAHRLDGDLVAFHIEETLAVCGAELRQIEFPPGAAVALLVRGREVIAAKGTTRLEPGDHVYVYYREADAAVISLLFGAPSRA